MLGSCRGLFHVILLAVRVCDVASVRLNPGRARHNCCCGWLSYCLARQLRGGWKRGSIRIARRHSKQDNVLTFQPQELLDCVIFACFPQCLVME